jgi:hypothetical protein
MRATMSCLVSTSARRSIVFASPRTTASTSVVKRRTPRAMIAIPPISIHGARDSSSARESASTASSRRLSVLSRRLGTTFDPRPPLAHRFHQRFAHGVARPGPCAHPGERLGSCNGLGNGLLGLRAFRAQELALSRSSGRMASPHSSNRVVHVRNVPYELRSAASAPSTASDGRK